MIVSAVPADRTAVTEILLEAFLEDPVLSWGFPIGSGDGDGGGAFSISTLGA